jgi:hypothetical protein
MRRIMMAMIILMGVIIYSQDVQKQKLINDVQNIFESLHRCDSAYTVLRQQYEMQHNRIRE